MWCEILTNSHCNDGISHSGPLRSRRLFRAPLVAMLSLREARTRVRGLGVPRETRRRQAAAGAALPPRGPDAAPGAAAPAGGQRMRLAFVRAASRRIATNFEVGVKLPSPWLSSGTSGLVSG